MNGQDFSKQLSFLPDDLVEEAMQKAITHPSQHIFRAAACIALVIGLLVCGAAGRKPDPSISPLPGFLTVRVYAADNSSSAVLSPDTVLPHSYYWGFVNWTAGLPITLSVSEQGHPSGNIQFQVTVDGGSCYVSKGGNIPSNPSISGAASLQSSNFTVPNHTTIYWSQFIDAHENADFLATGTVAFIDIIVFDGDDVVGYTLLRLDRESPDGIGFKVSMVDSVSFYKGVYVSEQYAREQISILKDSQSCASSPR